MVRLTPSLKKELRTTIKNNLKRYISLLSIIFLGVMFYVGMKSNAPVLQDSMISFIDEHNYMDIEVASVFGFTEQELESLKEQVPEIATIEGGYETDVAVSFHNEKGKKVEKNVAIKTYSDKKTINRLYILEGREAKGINECVADGSLVGLGYKVGDTITIEGLENLKVKELTIVGFARSPEYIARDKGSSQLSSGKINYFLYVHEDNYDLSTSLYNVARVKLEYKYPAFSEKYNNYIETIKDKIDSLSDEISKERKQEFLNLKQNELEIAKEDFTKQKEDALGQLDSAKNQIDSAEEELNNAEANLMTDREIDLYIAYNKSMLDSTKEQLDLTRQMVDMLKGVVSSLSAGGESSPDIEDLSKQLKYWSDKLHSYEKTLDDLNKQLAEKRASCANVPLGPVKTACDSSIKYLENQIDAVNIQIANVKSNINAIRRVMDYVNSVGGASGSIDDYINSVEGQYTSAYAEYERALASYNEAKDTLKPKMQEARTEIEAKKIELEAAKKQYEEEYKKAEVEIEKGQEQLDDAEVLVNKLHQMTWYIFTRNDNQGYSQYYDDVERIDSLAKILPVLFFLVAGLVTASSISRMTVEEREKMGVLKSLGYTNSHILYKYIYYTLSACIIGTIIGIVVGSLVFPTIFAEVYKMLYYIIDIKYSLYIEHVIFAIILALISSIGVAYFSVKKTLKESASDLMRPKNNDKKVFVSQNYRKWRKMSFFKKVTIRNVLLNKGKSLMTILGIAGCTALIVTGFGARESISDIIFKQYGNIFDISSELFFDSDLTEFEMAEVQTKIKEDEDVSNATLAKMETISVKVGLKAFSVYLIVPNNTTEFSTMIDLRDTKKDTKLSLNNDGIIVTEKIAKLLDIKAGDELEYTNNDNMTFKVKVIGITKNYVFHYIYMTPSLYKKINDVEAKNNMLLAKFYDGVNAASKCKDYSADGTFISYLSMDDAKSAYDEVISRFNMILFVIIVSAALLAFVVLYNLAKINISEKTREIATLKVLGFRPKEVNKFINREMIGLTIIGILSGLIGGLLLTEIVVTTCELDNIMFYHGISYVSLIYATVLTIIFSLVINLLVRKDIKKINLVESLKTLE